MMRRIQRPPKFTKGFPTRENCDPTDPWEAYLWMLVALPGQFGGPLFMPVDVLQGWSKRLWDLAGPPDPAWEPRLKYRPPSATNPNLYSPGRWVDPGEPDPPDPRPPARIAADALLPAQKAELFGELYRDHTPRQRFEMMRRAAQQVTDDDPA